MYTSSSFKKASESLKPTAFFVGSTEISAVEWKSHRNRKGTIQHAFWITMPKEKRDRSASTDKSRASPYKCSTSHPKRSLIKTPLENDEINLKEWEEARCPVCMEHPHNAILLLCSSHNNNCRPYMCDTSYRHSNCFDQYRKSFSPNEEFPITTEPPSNTTIPESKLVCPLCRGTVNGWVVVDAARVFMNTKSRTCASETCEFSGTYSDLRKHARSVHPRVRPSEADPGRQRDWRRLERERDLGDLLSSLQSSMRDNGNEDSGGALSFNENRWLTVFFLIRVFRPGNGSRSSRARAQVTVRRRFRTGLWGESYEGDGLEEGNERSDGGSGLESGNLFQSSR
ncbi:hypothetical protein L1887_38244 [Cichorium endivia]|nr:hypothetical protein L1887_38244 [Cichorium endivia]